MSDVKGAKFRYELISLNEKGGPRSFVSAVKARCDDANFPGK